MSWAKTSALFVLRSGAGVARHAHNVKVAGSSPASAKDSSRSLSWLSEWDNKAPETSGIGLFGKKA